MKQRCIEAWAAVRAQLRAGPQAPSERRGVALLIVMLVMAILAAFSTEYNYKSYIQLHVASNIRDDAIAYYHARAAMEVGRLVIRSQNVADNMLNALSAFTGGRRPRTELWTLACEFANAFCTGKLKLMGKTFFDFAGVKGVGVEAGGMCKCRAKPEDGRVNINRVSTAQEKSQLFIELYSELVRQRDEPLLPGEIDKERAEIALNIIDWADADTQRTDLGPNGVIQSQQAEAISIDKGVKPKDAKFDTLSEVQFVPGVTPELYCALAEKMTPYATQKLNINQAPLSTLRGLVCDPQNITNAAEACYGPGGGILGTIPPVDEALMCLDICRTLRQSLMSPGFGNVGQFLTFFQRLRPALQPRPNINRSRIQPQIGTQSRMIRLETVGGSYGTYRSLTSVIDTSTGDYVYWREY